MRYFYGMWFVLCGLNMGGGSLVQGQNQTVVVPVPNLRTMILRDEQVLNHLALNTLQREYLNKTLDQVDYPLWRLRDVPHAQRAPQVLHLLQQLDFTLGQVMNLRQRRAYELLMVFATSEQVVPGASPIDWSQFRKRACRAPDFQDVEAWINSGEFTWEDVKGKVTILHFFTTDCQNCLNNLPLLNQWQATLDPNQVQILGIHTPEREEEKSIERVQEKVKLLGITYPVAVDNNKMNWVAWANPVWPSVYLIDKEGFIRYWWYGEWKQAGRHGDVWLRTHLAELIKER